jgi:3-oxoacyl-[acyl-carrier protein] reductase
MGSGSLLTGKHAIVVGAGGSVGAAIAREFAAEGAEVFLAGRADSGLKETARQIGEAGGHARTAVLDALDEEAVDAYADQVAGEAGRIDILVNAIGPLAREYGNGKSIVDLPAAEFMVPLVTIVRSQFITARAAARHMARQRFGVIMFLTGSPAKPHVQGASAIGAAFGAIENFTRQLALELGTVGVRAVCLRTSAMPDTRTIQDTTHAIMASMNISEEQAAQRLADQTLLKMSPRASDTAAVAAFLVSDRARMMTGTVLNSSAGATPD